MSFLDNIDSHLGGLELLTLKELSTRLKLKSLRGAANWCERNNVTIYKEGTRRFVYMSDFFNAYLKPLIQALKKTNPDNWKEEIDRRYNFIIDTSSPLPLSIHSSPKYKATSKYGKQFQQQSR